MPATLDFLLALLIALAMLACGLAFAVLTWVITRDQFITRRHGRASQWWPYVEGRITKSSLLHYGYRTGWDTLVEFSYTVNGRACSGKTIAFRFYEKQTHQQAMALHEKYPPGRPVTVFYDPDHPEISVLEPGADGLSLAGLLLIPAVLLLTSAVCSATGLQALLALWGR